MQCLGNAYADLTAIHYDSAATRAAGKLPFDVTIQSSDKEIEAELKNGEKIGFKPEVGTLRNNIMSSIDKAKNKGRIYTLGELKSFSFTIPWERWDGDATVHVKVNRGNELIAQMDLQDRDSTIKIIGIKNAETKNISKIKKHRTCGTSCSGDNCSPCSYSDIECDRDIQLSVDPLTGFIAVFSEDFVNCPADDVDPRSFFVN